MLINLIFGGRNCWRSLSPRFVKFLGCAIHSDSVLLLVNRVRARRSREEHDVCRKGNIYSEIVLCRFLCFVTIGLFNQKYGIWRAERRTREKELIEAIWECSYIDR